MMVDCSVLNILFFIVACNGKTLFGKSLENTADKFKNDDENLTPKIYKMQIETNVTNRYATTLITSKVRNLNSQPQEAIFSIITPEKAFISTFAMQIDGKKYDAYVQEKAEAKQTYNEAVASGQAAAHIEVSARDSNKFTVSVNLQSQSKAMFYLTYEELLERNDGKYDIIMNVHPGQLVEDLSVTVNIFESRPIRFVKTPNVRTGNDEQSKNEVDLNPESEIRKINESTVIVTIHPDIVRQKILATNLGGKEDNGVSGQFIVQYDLQRDPQNASEVLVGDGYFVSFFAPENLQPLNEHVVFVLDISGSMFGLKIEQLKKAMISILDELTIQDTFNIIEFDSNVKVWNILDEPNHEALPVTANKINIAKAKEMIGKIDVGSATDILSGLETGLQLINNITTKSDIQNIIIFLTDGQPNVRESDPNIIVKQITEMNIRRIPIFSLSFGEGADRAFLQRLSLKNLGFSKHIYDAADAYLQMEKFFKQISSPLLSNVTFQFTDDISSAVTKQNFPIMFSGGELFVAGKLQQYEFTPPSITGKGNKGFTEFKPSVYQVKGKLERLWAYLTIKQLLQKLKISENNAELRQEALRLALKYSFVTDVSSLVVVKPNNNSTVNTVDAFSNLQKPNFLTSQTPSRYYSASALPGTVPLRVSQGAWVPFDSSNPVAPSLDLIKVSVQYSTTPTNAKVEQNINRTSSTDVLNRLNWLRNALNSNDSLTLDSGMYALGLNETLYYEKECQNSVANSTGYCKLLNQCEQIYEIADLATYKKHFCEIEGYAGICCSPDIRLDENH